MLELSVSTGNPLDAQLDLLVVACAEDQIAESTRAAFAQLLKEGYAVGPRQQVQPTRPMDRVPERDRRIPNDRRTVRRGPGRRGPGGPEGDGPKPRGPGGPSRPRKPKGKPRLS